MLKIWDATGQSPGIPAGFCRLALFMLAVLIGSSIGCKRSYYRKNADAEAYELIAQKANDPRWDPPRISIKIDPRSRMYNPFNPDFPPMPPDDPTSDELMYCIDGRRNYQKWTKDGTTPYVENPDYMQYLPLNEDGILVLDLRRAVELALINAPNYQEAYESLYLSALDVSAERFEFDAQLFGGSNIFYRVNGKDRTGAPRNRLRVDSDLAVQKAYITGADLVVNFANSIIWDFHGRDTNAAFSLVDFSFVQPLLRGAGKDRVLTQLTLAERNLLANVRQLERFRRGFYLEIASGAGGVGGPSRIGGLFGGSGLQGFTGVGGGFGGVGGVFGGGGAFAAGAALQVGGFYGLLQDRQNIRNQQTNIAGLRANVVRFQQTLNENLRQIPENPTQVVSDRLQIAQARQQLYNTEFALASAEAGYQSSVDNFKIELGLPPHIGVVIEDPLLDQFNLLDTAIVPLQIEVAELSTMVGLTNEQILAAVNYEERDGQRVAMLEWSESLEGHIGELKTVLGRIKTLRNTLMSENMARARADINALIAALPERRKSLLRLSKKYPIVLDQEMKLAIEKQTRLPADIDRSILSVDRLDTLAKDLEQEFSRLQTQFEGYEETINKLDTTIDRLTARRDLPDGEDIYAQLESDVIFAIPGLLADLSSDVLDLSLIQARARTDAIDLVPVELSMNDALGIASINRLDWMNARAGLVNTWRAIAFVANDLEGVLNIVSDGDLRTVGDNPLKFRSTTGTLRMGVQFDAPFTRLIERNTYRQVLIDYQQARRNYYEFIDRVSQGLRSTLRTLNLNELNFETRRVAVLSAIEQSVLNDEITSLNEARGQAQSGTAARDIVQALSDLQNAQDAFTGVWLTYKVNRQFLDFNLGTMRLDSLGLWIDPGPIRGGEPPFVIANCPEDGNPLLSPDDEMWMKESEEYPAAMPEILPPGGTEAETEPIRIFRLPQPGEAA
ncbi:MAG: hypothetical protein GY768_13440 [Planctomycetaceae bacterium]|nr:hypothetical protein [Planctomycetaceae bacterium]